MVDSIRRLLLGLFDFAALWLRPRSAPPPAAHTPATVATATIGAAKGKGLIVDAPHRTVRVFGSFVELTEIADEDIPGVQAAISAINIDAINANAVKGRC